MPTSCVFGLIKIASWFKFQGYDIYHLGIKGCTEFNRQNTLRFLWKQAFEKRAAQNNLFVNISLALRDRSTIQGTRLAILAI